MSCLQDVLRLNFIELLIKSFHSSHESRQYLLVNDTVSVLCITLYVCKLPLVKLIQMSHPARAAHHQLVEESFSASSSILPPLNRCAKSSPHLNTF